MRQLALILSFACFVSAGLAAAPPAAITPPPQLDSVRKALAAAVAARDIKAVAALTNFPLAFSGYEAPDSVSQADFLSDKNNFNGMFFEGDAHIVGCLRTGKLEFEAKPTFAGSPWVIDCDGNEYYFGQRGGKWLFTGYENINE